MLRAGAWSSGHGMRLMLRRLWVRIAALYTGWAFFTYICCKNFNDVCLKRPKINDKWGRGWAMNFFNLSLFCSNSCSKLGNSEGPSWIRKNHWMEGNKFWLDWHYLNKDVFVEHLEGLKFWFFLFDLKRNLLLKIVSLFF